jgi:hypothetical protein
MALKLCFECGNLVSTEAPKCPACGAPDPTGQSLLLIADTLTQESSKCGRCKYLGPFVAKGYPNITDTLILGSVFGLVTTGLVFLLNLHQEAARNGLFGFWLFLFFILFGSLFCSTIVVGFAISASADIISFIRHKSGIKKYVASKRLLVIDYAHFRLVDWLASNLGKGFLVYEFADLKCPCCSANPQRG